MSPSLPLVGVALLALSVPSAAQVKGSWSSLTAKEWTAYDDSKPKLTERESSETTEIKDDQGRVWKTRQGGPDLGGSSYRYTLLCVANRWVKISANGIVSLRLTPDLKELVVVFGNPPSPELRRRPRQIDGVYRVRAQDLDRHDPDYRNFKDDMSAVAWLTAYKRAGSDAVGQIHCRLQPSQSRGGALAAALAELAAGAADEDRIIEASSPFQEEKIRAELGRWFAELSDRPKPPFVQITTRPSSRDDKALDFDWGQAVLTWTDLRARTR